MSKKHNHNHYNSQLFTFVFFYKHLQGMRKRSMPHLACEDWCPARPRRDHFLWDTLRSDRNHSCTQTQTDRQSDTPHKHTQTHTQTNTVHIHTYMYACMHTQKWTISLNKTWNNTNACLLLKKKSQIERANLWWHEKKQKLAGVFCCQLDISQTVFDMNEWHNLNSCNITYMLHEITTSVVHFGIKITNKEET